MESRKRAAAAQPAGGYKQKLARHVEAPKPSAVYSILMEKWAWGAISQPLMQEIAGAAIADGIDNEDLKSLAVPHLTRLQDKLPVTPLSHALSYMPCVSKTVAGKLVEASLAMLLPHQMFAALWQFSKNIFIDKLCGGTPDNIPKFWTAMQDHPAYSDTHPIKIRPDHTTKCIPVSLHGDGVASIGISKSWAKSIDALSWGSVLSCGSAVTCNFLIMLQFWKLVVQSVDNNSWTKFTKKLAWSFYWMFVGKWPSRDYMGNLYDADSFHGTQAGTPLADGFYAGLWLLLGDLEWMAKARDLENSGALSRCACCPANCSDVPWTEVHAASRWRARTWLTREAWEAAHPNRSLLFKMVPGLSALNFCPDVMHTMHLGSYQYFLGSVLEYLAFHLMPGRPEENVATMWQTLYESYKVCTQ